MLISAFTAIAVFVIIIVIAGVLSWWIGSGSNYDQSYTRTFVSILMCAIAVVLLLYYYNALTLQGRTDISEEMTNMQDTSEKAISDIVDALAEANTVIPHFVASLYPIHFNAAQLPTADPDHHLARVTRLFVSKKIFYSWQVVVHTGYKDRGAAFIAYFLQQAHSPLLAEQWQLLKISYSDATQRLGDLLFAYSQTITDNTVSAYQQAAELLRTDAKYAKIFCGG